VRWLQVVDAGLSYPLLASAAKANTAKMAAIAKISGI
jgi:uncharacterized membrane protein